MRLIDVQKQMEESVYQGLNFAKGVLSMKKLIIVLVILMFSFGSSFASGGKNHGSKGQGSTGSTGKGATTQNSR